MARSTHESAREFFSQPHRYLANNPYLQLRAEVVRQQLGSVAGLTLLDVGAGDATASRALLSEVASLTLLDFSPAMLARATRQVPEALLPRVTTVSGDVLEVSISEQFDLVLCLGLLAHHDRWPDIVGRVASWLRPAGVCVVQITDGDALAARLTRAWGNLTRALYTRHTTVRMSQQEVVSVARGHGLTLTNVHHHPFVPGLRVLPGPIGQVVLQTAASVLPQPLASERLLRFEKA